MSVWFAAQAMSAAPDTVEHLIKIMQHPPFDAKMPNHWYNLVRNFAANNPVNFHRKDGAGYKFIVDAVLQVDPDNPQVAGRILLEVFNDWHKFDPARQALMLAQLRRLEAVSTLSQGTKDLVSKKLAKAPPVVVEEVA